MLRSCWYREIAGGSYCMDAVRDAFAAAASKLRRMLARPGQATGSLLARVLPVEAALSRDPGRHAGAPADDVSDNGEPDLAPARPSLLPHLGLPSLLKASPALRGNGAATPSTCHPIP